MAEGSIGHIDYFISRAGADAPFAIWLGQLLNAQGKRCVLQDKDFGHQDFMGAMDDALKSGSRVIGVLTQAYLESDYTIAEASAAVRGDPLNKQQRLVLFKYEPCAPGGVLANIAYTNLLSERRQTDWHPLARKILLALGIDTPRLEGVPSPPEGTLSAAIQILHPEVQEVPGFAGRADELAALDAALWAKGGTAALTNVAPSKTAAAQGLGGVGKTVLAKEYAWRNRARYHGVWWVRAEKRETLLDDLIQLGANFIDGLAEEPDRERAAHQAIAHIESAGYDKPWLIVYDNVEEPNDLKGLTPRIGAHILITTRFTDWGKSAEPVKIGVFPPDVAAQYLLDATGRMDREGAASLAATLGHLPLALDHAAAYCRRTGIAFATYETMAADLLRKAPKGASYDTPVFASFSLAIDKVAKECPAADALVAVCSFLAPDRIPFAIFPKEFLNEVDLTEAVRVLSEVSLIVLEIIDDGVRGFSIHRLVQQVMRTKLDVENDSEIVTTAAIGLMARAFVFVESDVRTWPTCSRLLPHALEILKHAPDEGDAAQATLNLLTPVGACLRSRAAYVEAEAIMRRALAIAEKRLGGTHTTVAAHLNLLAQVLGDNNRLSEAETLMRRALAIVGESGKSEPWLLAGNLSNLAGLLNKTNRSIEAEPLLRRAVAILEEHMGPDHPNVAATLGVLALLLTETNRTREAEVLFRRALAILEHRFGCDNPQYAGALSNLAHLLNSTDRPLEAEPLLRRSLAIDETFLGHDHPHVAIRLNNLAQVLQVTGRRDEAEPLMRRALAISEASLGVDHPDVAIRLCNLAQLLADTDRPIEADPLMRRALVIHEQSYGPNHPDVARDLNNLAMLLKKTGHLAEAEPFLRRALAIVTISLGPEHPATRLYSRNLEALLASKDFEKDFELLWDELDKLRSSPPPVPAASRKWWQLWKPA